MESVCGKEWNRVLIGEGNLGTNSQQGFRRWPLCGIATYNLDNILFGARNHNNVGNWDTQVGPTRDDIIEGVRARQINGGTARQLLSELRVIDIKSRTGA